MLGALGVLAVLGVCGGIFAGCYLFSNRDRPVKRKELHPEDRLSLMEESTLGIHKLDFTEWQVTNIPNNGNDVLTVKLIDTVDKQEISSKRITTNNREGKLSVAAIEREIQSAMHKLAATEIAKRNRAAAIGELVSKYNGKEA